VLNLDVQDVLRRMLWRMPFALGLTLVLLVLWSIWAAHRIVRAAPPPPTPIVDHHARWGAAGALVTIGLLISFVTPSRAILVVSLTFFPPAVLVCLVALVFGGIPRFFRRTISRRPASTIETLPLREELPAELAGQVARFAALGFEGIGVERRSDASVCCILFRSRDGIAAEVVTPPTRRPKTSSLTLELTSVLVNGALFCSGTNGLGFALWEGELRQVFPDAGPEDLLISHENGIRFLLDRGFAPLALVSREVLDIRSRYLEVIREAEAAASDEDLMNEVRRTQGGELANVGPIEENGVALERLASFSRDGLTFGLASGPPPIPAPPPPSGLLP
jgi:hypothetical protein